MKPEETALAAAAAAAAVTNNNNEMDANEPSTSRGQVRGRQQQQLVNFDGSDRCTCINRILKELDEISKHPPPNCGAESYKDDICRWKAFVKGPPGTAYEGGNFKLDIRFPKSYPVRFTTRIYHCNVDSRGVICLDVLNERWSPVMTIAMLLLSIWVLIGECNPNDPLVPVIADHYKSNRKEHDKVARTWTLRYAREKATPTATSTSTPDSTSSSTAAATTTITEKQSDETLTPEQT
ncbi:uncharacterized protein [Drosophila tropicalis]|uniref:uncharacterized protein n=1 Tax=Drosophila tropicalis TaxID=46794 RepID=UPI0035ABA704